MTFDTDSTWIHALLHDSTSENLSEISALVSREDETFLSAASNSSGNSSSPIAEFLEALQDPFGTLLTIFCILFIIATVIGNVFVIIAVLTERHLQKPQNYLILSLAIAGLGLKSLGLVMNRRWLLGSVLCEIWNFADVTACSASILHLVAIAVDRYCSVTNVQYSHMRKREKIFAMIALVWLLSLLISIPPIVGWKDANYYQRIDDHECQVSQDAAFQVFSTSAAFYVPLILIISLYSCIYRAAKKRIRKTPQGGGLSNSPSALLLTGNNAAGQQSAPATLTHLKIPSSSFSTPSPSNTASTNNTKCSSRLTRLSSITSLSHVPTTVIISHDDRSHRLSAGNISVGRSSIGSFSIESADGTIDKSRLKLRFTIEAKRERKAFHTLAIITGTFIVCWLPFFITAIVRPFVCQDCIDSTMEAVFAWLGWGNSLINPVIYTVFSPDFRKAFKRIVQKLYQCPPPRGKARKPSKPKRQRQKDGVVPRNGGANKSKKNGCAKVYQQERRQNEDNSVQLLPPKGVPEICILNPSTTDSQSHTMGNPMD